MESRLIKVYRPGVGREKVGVRRKVGVKRNEMTGRNLETGSAQKCDELKECSLVSIGITALIPSDRG